MLVRSRYVIGFDGEHKMKTIAEKVSAQFGNDGMNFRDANCAYLRDVCDAAGAIKQPRGGYGSDVYKLVFPDSSVIFVHSNAWDVGYSDCWCWATRGHDHAGDK